MRTALHRVFALAVAVSPASALSVLGENRKLVRNADDFYSTARQLRQSGGSDRSTVSFYVTGDSPYSPEEAEKLKKDLEEIPESDGNFIVHVGDMNNAFEHGCSAEWFKGVHDLVRASSPKNPVFVVPGNHDVRDCPKESKHNFERYFAGFDMNWNHTFNVSRHPNRPYNFAFYRRGVLFVGMHMVHMHSAKQRKIQKSDHRNFVLQNLRHAVEEHREVEALVLFGHEAPKHHHEHLFQPVLKAIRPLKIPVLYVHGDLHFWEVEEGALHVPSFTRLQVSMGKDAPPAKVTIKRRTATSAVAFEFDRRRVEDIM